MPRILNDKNAPHADEVRRELNMSETIDDFNAEPAVSVIVDKFVHELPLHASCAMGKKGYPLVNEVFKRTWLQIIKKKFSFSKIACYQWRSYYQESVNLIFNLRIKKNQFFKLNLDEIGPFLFVSSGSC